MKKVKLFFTALVLLLGTVIASAQGIRVAGQVIDQNGNPVPGTTVMVKGTTNGVAADVEGTYVITVPSNATLVFSSIGYSTQEVAVDGRNSINVTLAEDTTMLDDVVVVAFGTTTKEAFTGSAAVVKSEDIQKHTTSNVANTLVGSVAGLQMRGASGAPGASQGSMNIRGLASMYASTSPLIIVDGAPYPASLSNIPTSDIESVTVLKDAASAALYGARGAAGVIIVTTKRGSRDKATINVDTRWGVTSRAIQDYETVNNPAAYMEALYSMYNNYLMSSGSYTTTSANAAANSWLYTAVGANYVPFTLPEGQLLVGTNGKLNPNATLGRKVNANGTTYWMQPDNWTDIAYRNALRHEHNITINGTSGKMSYYSSLSYLNEDGVIQYSDFQRVSARLKADYQATDWLKVGANVNYVDSRTDNNPNMDTSLGAGNLMYYTTMIAPIYPAYVRGLDQGGNPVILTDAYGHERFDYGVASTNYGSPRRFLATGNPLGANRWNKSYNTGAQFSGTFTAEVAFTPHLRANVSSTIIRGQTNATSLLTGFEGPSAGNNGQVTKSSSTDVRTNNVQTLTYDNSFGDHNLNVMLGHEYYKTHGEYLAAQANGAYSEDILEINAFATVPKGGASSYSSNHNIEGFFASAQYNYMNKYYASASFRRDASSRFAKEHRWGNFWTVGGAWIVSKEDFFNVPWVDQLKLKASIGQQGNENIGDFQYSDRYSIIKADDYHAATSFTGYGNEDITWETTTNINVGAEFSLWRGRLSGEVNLYDKKITDLLFWISIPESAGARGYYGNIGDFSNYGVEFTLNGSIIRTRDLQWDAQFNIASNATRIGRLPESKVGAYGGFNEGSYWYKKGGPMYNYFRPAYAGVNENGEALYYTDSNVDVSMRSTQPGTQKNGTTTNVNQATYYEYGSILPKAFGGFGTSVTYKGFDASVTFDYQLGGKIYDSRYQNLMGVWTDDNMSGGNISADYVKAWSVSNKDSNIPRWQFNDKYNASTSDRFLTNASYLNFQSFTVGYTLPKFTDLVSRIRVYVMGENLCFWSARRGLDPRYSYGGNTTVAVYSPTRNISAGVQFTF